MVKLEDRDLTEMDDSDSIATLSESDEMDMEHISEEQLTDQNEKVIEARRDDTPTASPSPSEYIFKYETESHSPADSIDAFESASPTNTEYINELDEISSNIEYLDETEEEFRLTEIIQKSKEKSESQMDTVRRRKLNTDKPISKDSNLNNVKKKTEIKHLEEDETVVHRHHENLRTVLRHSNATTFVCRGIWYLCTLCPTKYTNPRELKAHTLRVHNTLKSQQKLYSARKMKRYVVKLDITHLKCKLCSMGINSLKDLLEHLHTEHGQPVHRDLPNHMIPFKFDSNVLRCAECDREFAFFKMLQCHMNDHYKNYTCEVCDTGYVTSGSLMQHMRLHADGEYTCKWCKKLFDNKHKLADHVKLVHFGQKMRNKCAYCDMKFHVFETKNKHMEEEHGVKTPVIKCQACEKCFRSTRHLTAHMKNFHLIAEKNHQCLQCDRRFSAPHMLKAHMTVHSTEKDFKCVVCEKAFSRKKTLREHVRIHTNDRRFKCELCGMAFVQKCSLTGHMKNKHADKHLE